MPKITFRSDDGSEQRVDAKVGLSVMEAATIAGVDGIVGECGGNITCSTCHVFVDPQDGHRLPAMSEDEDFLLDGTATQRRATSRLSCQIPVVEDIDGLVVDLPETQI
ncbi:2Fe-2S iron-sulfur cluster-binding protein [Pseudonocardia dioxanivorans]|jgi:2Fe-2S ferredoxin|uniref:2Fe-2S iron-sulfur cluster-binding protein n=1 Tax=Pseudonocardia dioxanivorans TaxID=240495 RepID=UPI000CD106BE|nr:2Fe-2S iron-sulfur cluster-binding protein [Pseudonocardia dioxanivorans]